MRKRLKPGSFSLMALLFLSNFNSVIAQILPDNFTIKGQVTNEQGQPLPYANVVIRDLGLGDAELVELLLVIDLTCGYNRYVQGLQANMETGAFGSGRTLKGATRSWPWRFWR